MTSPKESMPYVLEQLGSSILETTTILNGILRPEGYSNDIINDIAINLFLDNERKNLHGATNMHLLALKKALLYAIPVIGPPKSMTGIELTSQVTTPAIQYDVKGNVSLSMALVPGDKHRVIGIMFPNQLTNHLPYDIFPWKYFNAKPLDYQPSPIDISHMSAVDAKSTPYGKIYLIKAKHYEDTVLFNEINRYISIKLSDDMNAVLAAIRPAFDAPSAFVPTQRIKPFSNIAFLDRINATLQQEIDPTYTIAFYESLQMAGSWLLYDQIQLLGFSSTEVSQLMTQMTYSKNQKNIARTNTRMKDNQRLLNTRAEKITREKYPYYFDYTDRRSIFVRFNRFALDKIPKKDQQNVRILLEKELADQHAILHNKCEHIQHLRSFKESERGSSGHAFTLIESYIDYKAISDDRMYPCKLCAYPLICAHEVDLQEALQSIVHSHDNGDQSYWVKQKIINQYKLVGRGRTGNEDTEVSFTFYCKYCGEELGKTDNIIQSSIRTNEGSVSSAELDPDDQSIYITVSSMISTYMNQSIVPTSRRAITKLIFDEIKSDIKMLIRKSTTSEQNNVDTLIKYLAGVYTLASLISINTHKLKSKDSILLQPKQSESRNTEPVATGGVQLKDELFTAFKIMQANTALKRIGITDDRIKSLLIESFKSMNKVFADDAVQFKSSTPKDRTVLDVLLSPLTYYAQYMYKRDHGAYHEDPVKLMGVDIDLLYPRSKTGARVSTHALYTNVYNPVFTSKVNQTDLAQYKTESYVSIVNYITQEPKNGKYLSIVTAPPSESILKFELENNNFLRNKRTTPMRFLPVENGREHNFDLKVFQIAYCVTEGETIRSHRWGVCKKGNKLIYTCQHCSIDITQAVERNNETIINKLHDRMIMEAFFELYALVCPIKDAHVFVNGHCSQCGATTEQLESMSPTYYKKYSTLFNETRQTITANLLEDTAAIVGYAGAIVNTPTIHIDVDVDMVKLETLATSITKLYNHLDLKSIGMQDNVRSLSTIESHVRTLYSHYTFAKNSSAEQRGHYDSNFFDLIQGLLSEGIKSSANKLKPLPPYPSSTNADQLLLELLQIIFNLIKDGDAAVNKIVRYIVNKIVEQDSRRGEYNFAKLKSTAQYEDRDELDIRIVGDDEEEEIDMFDGYDISADDLEDNMDGDIE